MSEEITFRYLNDEEQLRFTTTMYQVVTACGESVDNTDRLERDLCQQFALHYVGDIRPEQLNEALRWMISVFMLEYQEHMLQSVYERANDIMRDLQFAYLMANRQRTLLAVQYKFAVAVVMMLVLSLAPSLTAMAAPPVVNIQAQAGTNELANAESFTVTLTEEEVQAWLAEYPAAAPYAYLISKVERTNYVGHSAEYVIATLLTDAMLVSAQVNDTRGIRLYQDGTLQELNQPLNFLSLSLNSAVNEGASEDQCNECMNSCRYMARSVRAAEENVAVAKLAVTARACAVAAAANVGLGAVCVGGALVLFYADINLAKQKYFQADFQCGQSTCKRLNGIPCRVQTSL